MELRTFNPDGFDAFTYGVSFIKQDTGKEYDINAFVDEFNVWESLFAKAMQAKLLITDGAGLVETIALQPGDQVRIVAFKGADNEVKLDKTFEILSIGMGQQVSNKQGRVYSISCVTSPAVKNKVRIVNRALSGKLSDMATTVAREYLDIAEVEVEETFGEKKNVVMPGYRPFKMLQWLANHAVSLDGGEDNSFYLFYEDRDGFRFKTLRQILSDATRHEYTMVGDSARFGDSKDVYRIISFQQNRMGSNASRLESGMIQNETLEFDILGRKLMTKKFDFAKDAEKLRLMGSATLVANTASVIAEETKAKGVTNALKIRSAEEGYGETNTMGRKYGAMMAQKAMFNQLSYTLTLAGNPAIKAGDKIMVEAGALNADDVRGMDKFLNGEFLVGNVRHRMVGTREFNTVIDIFKDGYDTEYVSMDRSDA